MEYEWKGNRRIVKERKGWSMKGKKREEKQGKEGVEHERKRKRKIKGEGKRWSMKGKERGD